MVCPSTISSEYSAYIPSSPVPGTVVNVSCATGFVWNSAPTTGTRNASCVAGTPATWNIFGGAQCLGEPYILINTVYFH